MLLTPFQHHKIHFTLSLFAAPFTNTEKPRSHYQPRIYLFVHSQHTPQVASELQAPTPARSTGTHGPQLSNASSPANILFARYSGLLFSSLSPLVWILVFLYELPHVLDSCNCLFREHVKHLYGSKSQRSYRERSASVWHTSPRLHHPIPTAFPPLSHPPAIGDQFLQFPVYPSCISFPKWPEACVFAYILPLLT